MTFLRPIGFVVGHVDGAVKGLRTVVSPGRSEPRKAPTTAVRSASKCAVEFVPRMVQKGSEAPLGSPCAVTWIRLIEV